MPDETSVNPITLQELPAPERNLGQLLYQLPAEVKTLIRKLEKFLYKLNAAETAITFNKVCMKEGLLPKYTNLRLHDPTAADDRHTLAFRRRLAQRQLEEKQEEARHIASAVEDLQQQWCFLQEDGDRAPILEALQQLQDNDRSRKEDTILRKLISLNGGKLRLPQKRQAYINLTDYSPNHNEEALLQLGLNCHYADRPTPRTKRLEIEVLLDNLLTLEKEGKVELSDSLRPLLLAEALTSRHPVQHRSFMTKELKEAAKKLKTAQGITIRRADKTPALVLINTDEYHRKLDTILDDDSKFKKIRRNPIEDIKREANKIIDRVNALSSSIKLSKIKGDYEPGYIYGNVKTHKNGNPLRPIISQIPTPTYRLAKQLNTILTPYIPSEYRVKSSSEFLRLLRDSPSTGTIASLDVESLFTNVPVEETINMTCDKVYRDETTPSLPIPEDCLRRLLKLCTMSAPFITHKGEMYTQIDGVAMGSSLGVLFADFYMGVIEERVFSNQPKPDIYCRYVDDTFVKTDSPEKVEELRRCFEESSALRFTSESSDNGHLPFLDVKVSQGSDNKFSTEVYRKSTNLGLCLNGESECPERYKKSAISAYTRRALTHCSTWPSTTKEFENATQILVNNGFSNKDINNTIRKAVDKWYMDSDDNNRPQEKDLIKIFYKNQFHAKYKEDERALRTIIQEQVKPVNINSEINLVIYYKNRKSANLIMKNSPTSNSDMLKKRNIVYAYTCPHERCSQQYIGMTTMRLSKRISCHAQEGAIYNHTRSNHNARIKRDEIIKNIKIIDTNSDSKRLRYLEALHILEKKPLMNCTEEPLLLPTTLPANHN